MRFFIPSLFVVALLSGDFIVVDAKLRGASKIRKLSESGNSLASSVIADGDSESSDVAPPVRKLSESISVSEESADGDSESSDVAPPVRKLSESISVSEESGDDSSISADGDSESSDAN
eukprot:CAMPEP_0197733898 /NCGR_PEP_ID=MMETSP1434-20131217/44143_1 /TAXON_ID=265543 /ORGANISM="Minutocellus polymorphus, Strain CCMP3303" /LENGTH=118 /DNA_ID=CAMNT_0043321295 /DNA_START=380 /DNA_END=736 /DNA_ORIENTATION=-